MRFYAPLPGGNRNVELLVVANLLITAVLRVYLSKSARRCVAVADARCLWHPESSRALTEMLILDHHDDVASMRPAGEHGGVRG